MQKKERAAAAAFCIQLTNHLCIRYYSSSSSKTQRQVGISEQSWAVGQQLGSCLGSQPEEREIGVPRLLLLLLGGQEREREEEECKWTHDCGT